MSWKDFLRPDKKKIVVFAFITLVAIVLIFNPFLCENYNELNACSIAYYVKGILGMPLYYFLCVSVAHQTYCPFLTRMLGDLIVFIAWPLAIIFWYLFSCIIIFAYDRIRMHK